jgi:aminoglycoside 2'-N-acetyltransferase I
MFGETVGVTTQTLVAPDPSVLDAIRQLCADAFGPDFSDDDWAHTTGGTHVVFWSNGLVVAHAAVVERSMQIGSATVRVGYIEGVATAPDRRGEGLGSAVVAEANRIIAEQFELGVLSTSSAGFYGRLGWQQWRGKTYVQSGAERTRTADEDDGVMVLLVAGAASIDITNDLTCRERRGDNW